MAAFLVLFLKENYAFFFLADVCDHTTCRLFR